MSEREQALNIIRKYMVDEWTFTDETLTEELQIAYQRGFEEAKELAAQVIDGEIELREKFDEHMEPIDKLAAAIRELKRKP